MYQPFFPNPGFAWVFYLALVCLTILTSYTDLRHMVIPKSLTVSGLALGVVMNLVRGAWMGAEGQRVWLLPPSVGNGLLDGLVFTLAGFLVAFAVMFFMYVLGTCGGGDVKLFCALGAWLGPFLIVFLYAASLVALLLLMMVVLLKNGLYPSAVRATLEAAKPGNERRRSKKKWRIAYGLPVAVATTLLLLWVFRVDLQLAAPPPSPPSDEKVQAHAL